MGQWSIEKVKVKAMNNDKKICSWKEKLKVKIQNMKIKIYFGAENGQQANNCMGLKDMNHRNALLMALYPHEQGCELEKIKINILLKSHDSLSHRT